MASDVTANGVGQDKAVPSSNLIKKLYGVPSERGGTSWHDEAPSYVKSPAYNPDHALITRVKEARTDNTKKAFNLDSVSVQSPYLKKLLRNVLGNYPGENLDAQDIEFKAPFYPFFHQSAGLASAYEHSKRGDGKRSEEIDALASIFREEFDDSIEDAQSLVRNGNISFRLLWALYPLGCPVFGYLNGQQHCMLVNETKYLLSEVPPRLKLELLLLDFDGERYGWIRRTVFVAAFAGTAKISMLPAIPFHFYGDVEKTVEKLYARGVASVDLTTRSPAYESYDGLMRLHRPFDDEVEVFVEGRIMVEAKGHAKAASRHCPAVSSMALSLEYLVARDSLTKIAKAAKKVREGPDHLSTLENLNKHPVLSLGSTKLQPLQTTDKTPDNSPLATHRWTEYLVGIKPETLCRSTVRGYCLVSKSWAEFEVENIARIQWNKNAFDALVLSPARKRLLEALVRQQQHNKTDFDDVVQGKGQGLIMLLTGPPGVGKTLTAESIADRLQLPLYAVSASELGDSAKEIEQEFAQVLRLAASWNAVLLVDEADAFLERRTEGPAFLRILEYYKGILILTTNRSMQFDDAFYSRIHLTLPFKPLDRQYREDIWMNFLADANVSGVDLRSFAQEDLNGRQIKNIVKMARLLAADEGKPLNAAHVRDVLSVAREDSGPSGSDLEKSHTNPV